MTQQQENQTQVQPVFDWEEPERYSNDHTVKVARLQVEGFDCTVKVVYDYDHDWTECRGKFTSKWQEGAIKNPHAKYDNRVYEYFVPENTLKYHLKSLLNMGYTVQDARKEAVRYVKEDMAIAGDPDKSDLMAVGITITCSLKGVELGESSLWGIEVEWNDPYHYIDSCARDTLNEALYDAKKHLAELRDA